MKVIWKCKVTSELEQELLLPMDHTILKADYFNGDFCLWVLVDPTSPKSNYMFYTFGTGEQISIDNEIEYIDTFYYQKRFVFHMFKEKESK